MLSMCLHNDGEDIIFNLKLKKDSWKEIKTYKWSTGITKPYGEAQCLIVKTSPHSRHMQL